VVDAAGCHQYISGKGETVRCLKNRWTLAMLLALARVGLPSRLVAATLERAPGDLGKAESKGALFLVTASKGKEVWLFDSGSGELKPFLETGETWAKPMRLRGRGGDRFSPSAFRIAIQGDLIACANPLGVNLFNRDTGELIAEAPYLHHATAVAAMPDGSWGVSLIRLPFPEIERADKEKFGGPAPRFVTVNDKLEILRQGLAADLDRTPNQAAARALRLAASPDRVFAAELPLAQKPRRCQSDLQARSLRLGAGTKRPRSRALSRKGVDPGARGRAAVRS
jgi:hypothetical protein